MATNKKKSIVIADPDEVSRQVIREYIRNFPDFFITAECNNGLEAIRYINSTEPDLLFIEADLPGKDGFRVLQEAEHLPAVIFLTPTHHYAVKAFECNAVDYLLKPYIRARFDQALEKYISWQEIKWSAGFNKGGAEVIYPKKILIESGRRLKSIPVAEITHLKADRDYTWIHTANGETYLSVYGISMIQKKLDPQLFLRIHRSYIVNVDYISELYRDISKTFVALQNDVEINVGRSYFPQVKQLIF